MKIPNMLTILRILLIPIIAGLLLSDGVIENTAAAIIFIIAIITDWLDGKIARKYGQKSIFGTFMDPIADKMLILTAFFILSARQLIPIWMPLLMLFREFLVSGVRQVASTESKPVGANWMGKTKFILQALIGTYGMLIFWITTDICTAPTCYPILQQIMYYATLIQIILSYIFVIRFINWHKEKVLADI